MAARPCTGSLAIIWNTASSVKKSPSFLGSFQALRKSRTACSLIPGCLAACAGLCFVELLRGHQHRSGLRTLRRAHDASALEKVHEAARSGEADTELALQHRRRAQLRPHHELHG